MYSFKYIYLFLSLLFISGQSSVETEDIKYANLCEVCKVLSTELEEKLTETGKKPEILHIGYALDDVKPKKRTEYRKSELRLVESTEGICDKILEYNIHKERSDSTRFAKGMSETFQTLHGLVDKGVKVDLGIPYELWDKPSVEITKLKIQCETLLEDNEEAIENWYFNFQGKQPLKKYLCEEIVLRGLDKSCLYEKLEKKPKRNKAKDTKLKGDSDDSNVKEEL